MKASVRRHIESAHRIFLAGGTGFPEALVAQLEDQPDLLRGKQVTCGVIPGFGHSPPRVRDGTLEVFFGGRELLERPEVRFVPMQYRRIWNCIAGQRFDLSLLRLVADKAGALHYGMGVDFQPAALAGSSAVVAEVAKGDLLVPDAPAVPCSELVETFEVSPGRARPSTSTQGSLDAEVARRIGENVASLVRDGDCLQIGIGAIPDAVLGALLHHRDLGCHSGMITKGVADLHKAGVLTGARKTIDRGKMVTGFVLGDDDLECWAAECGEVALRPVSYTHDSGVLASLDDLVAINSAVEVDLFGQVNGEMIGGKQISGVGGSVDFARGVSLSAKGRSIVALPSTANGAKVSRIVRRLSAGNCATLLRTDVDFVVTEHGVARLAGIDVNARAESLVSIAAPRFRDTLLNGFSAS